MMDESTDNIPTDLSDTTPDYREHDADSSDNLDPTQSSAAAKYQAYASKHVTFVAKQPVYTCPHCGKKLTKLENFKLHLQHHDTNVLNFSCRCCRCAFKTKEELESHNKKKHNHVCDMCGQVFFSKTSVKEHKVIIHKQSLPDTTMFSCTYENCYRTFRRKILLENHINKEHKHINPYACAQCGQSFVSKYKCTEHERKHCSASPDKVVYKCGMCDLVFQHQASLNHHNNSVHDGMTYQCPNCGKVFKYRTNLNRHARKCNEATFSMSDTTKTDPETENSEMTNPAAENPSSP